MSKTIFGAVLTIVIMALLGGCASQATTEADFGNAVREAIMNQTYDIGATLESQPDAVTGADPYQLENVINAHRERSAQSRSAGYQTGMTTGNHR